jgi:hypothetical protein
LAKWYQDTFCLFDARGRKPPEVTPQLVNIALSDLEIKTTLGIGGFGRVELVSDIKT